RPDRQPGRAGSDRDRLAARRAIVARLPSPERVEELVPAARAAASGLEPATLVVTRQAAHAGDPLLLGGHVDAVVAVGAAQRRAPDLDPGARAGARPGELGERLLASLAAGDVRAHIG